VSNFSKNIAYNAASTEIKENRRFIKVKLLGEGQLCQAALLQLCAAYTNMVDAVPDIHITFATENNATGLRDRASKPSTAYFKDVYVSMDFEEDFL
jgi:hypothetical protein